MAVRNEERLGAFDSSLDRIGLSQHALEQRVELQTAAVVKNDNILAMHEKLDRLLCNKRRRSPTPPRRHSPSPVRTPREERSCSASPQPSAVSPAKTYDPEQRIKELKAIVANQVIARVCLTCPNLLFLLVTPMTLWRTNCSSLKIT